MSELVGTIGENKSRGIQETDHIMSVMGIEGDLKTIWDKSKPEEVENARQTFDNLRKKGYLAFRTNKDGSKGEQIREFYPDAEAMIMVPQMVGG